MKSVFLAACLACGAVYAQSPAATPAAGSAVSATPKVGTINVQEAISLTDEAKKAAAELQARFQPKQTELENENKEIQALQQKLQDGGNTLSAEAKAEMTRTIERKQRELNSAAEDARTDFTNAQNEIINKIGGKMLQVVNNFAKENGYSMILDAQAVVFADNAVNITSDVVKAYQRQYPVANAPAATTPTRATTPARPRH